MAPEFSLEDKLQWLDGYHRCLNADLPSEADIFLPKRFLKQLQAIRNNDLEAVAAAQKVIMKEKELEKDAGTTGQTVPTKKSSSNSSTAKGMSAFKVIPPPKIKMQMTPGESQLFEHFVGKAVRYLEFGSGGSTIAALSSASIESVHSVESDPAWIERMQSVLSIQEAHKSGRLHMHHADIGPVKRWGHPSDSGSTKKWPNYSWRIWQNLPRNFDCILIDGRFRVACGLVAAIMTASADPAIMVPNYYTRGRKYTVLEKALYPIESVDSLQVFRIRLDIAERMPEVLLSLANCIFDPS